mgnify:CR=1 FL=1
MSCKACEECPVEIYIRIGTANIKVVGCAEHLRKLITILKEA